MCSFYVTASISRKIKFVLWMNMKTLLVMLEQTLIYDLVSEPSRKKGRPAIHGRKLDSGTGILCHFGGKYRNPHKIKYNH